MATLVTLAEAKTHLRITTPPGDPGDTDITAKLTAAEAIVFDYINTTATWRTTSATWDATTLPQVVRAAILIQLGELSRFRGDEVDGDSPTRTDGEDLSPRVRELLRRQRDPVVA